MENYVVRMGIFQKKNSVTVSEFCNYWHYNHGAIASKMANLLKYDQNHSVMPLHFDLAQKELNYWVDGYSKLWFEDAQAQNSNDQETIDKLRRDEEHLFEKEVLVVAEEHITIAMDPEAGFVKMMMFLQRSPKLSAEEFKEAWLNNSAELLKKLPGVIGCRQNWVFDRVIVDTKDEYKR